MAYRVFLSHSSRDALLIAEAQGALTPLGVDVYLAEHDLQPGQLLSSKVEAAINRSHLVVVFLTANGYQSSYVQQEIGYARRASKLVIPLVAPDVPRDQMGMLVGVEDITLDPGDPAGAIKHLTAIVERRAADKATAEMLLAIGAVTVIMIIALQARPPLA